MGSSSTTSTYGGCICYIALRLVAPWDSRPKIAHPFFSILRVIPSSGVEVLHRIHQCRMMKAFELTYLRHGSVFGKTVTLSIARN